MIKISLQINIDNNNYTCLLNEETPSNCFILSDRFIAKVMRLYPEYEWNNVQNVYFHIEGEDLEWFTIQNYSYRSDIYITFNDKMKIRNFDCQSVNIIIVGADIKRLACRDGSINISKGSVGAIDFDPSNGSSKKITRKLDDYTVSIDYCDIEYFFVYNNANEILIQDSKIKRISFNDNSILVNRFIIKDRAIIDSINLDSKFQMIKISKSNIDKLESTKETIIDQLEVIDSVINNSYGFDINNFKNMNIYSWLVIKESSKNAANENLYYHSCYKIAEYYGKNKRFNTLLKCINGYGYKPLRCMIWIPCLIIGFGLVFSFIDLWNICISGKLDYNIMFNDNIIDLIHKKGHIILNNLFNNVYFSGATFTTTGYGDIAPVGNCKRIIAVIESCIGVSMFSLLIYSITKRHMD